MSSFTTTSETEVNIAVNITDLAPNTTYYIVVNEGGGREELGQFTTPSKGAGGYPFADMNVTVSLPAGTYSTDPGGSSPNTVGDIYLI